MGVNDMVQKTVDSGTAPIQLAFEKIEHFESKKVILRSFLEINSLELGKLGFRQYSVVAGRSKQGSALLERQVEKIFGAYEELSKAYDGLECITVPILSRTLMDGSAAELLFRQFRNDPAMPSRSLCAEISSDVLFEDMESIKARFSELKDLNIKLAIRELGDEFCPVFRLKQLPFDLAFADPYALAMLKEEDESAGGLPDFLHLLGAKIYAPEIAENEKEFAKRAGYNGYSLEGSRILFEEVNVHAEQ